MTEATSDADDATGSPTGGDSETADATCARCGERFPTERLRDLHRGLEHYRALDDRERAAYEAAYESETEDLRSFRLRALAVLVALYFAFLFTYSIVT